MSDTHGAKGKKWTGFDLDGTLADYDGWKGIDHIGKPIKAMCDRIKSLHDAGEEVRILTARVAPREDGESPLQAKKVIEKWCKEHLGFVPPITYEKDALMEKLYDDRVEQVIPNTGVTMEEAALKLFQIGQKDKTAQMLIDYLTDET